MTLVRPSPEPWPLPRLSLLDDVRLSAQNLADTAGDVFTPSLRIGVTGLSRAGKTVFLTSMIHALMHRGHLPALRAYREGRLVGATLSAQPDDDVARFAIEQHVHDLLHKRVWPTSTRQISELRLTLRFEPQSAMARALGRTSLNLDMVDYPGEWLLDLPLLDQSFAQFSALALEKARASERASLAAPFLALLDQTSSNAPLDEEHANRLHAAYTGYLRACRADEASLSMLPPGRFLMPGDLEGSPALTFAPLDLAGQPALQGSLHHAMARRFAAYKRLVVKPFFMDHFARLDRQIILVDALAAMNAGPHAMTDLRDALAAILACFKPGRRHFLSTLLGPRIDKMVFAATKADHLHHHQHDQLEAVLDHLVASARQKALFSGAQIETLAIASVRATREAEARRGGQTIKAVAGTPMNGETIDGVVFDGKREVAIFPGDLPADPAALLEGSAGFTPIRFVRFRPPGLPAQGSSQPSLPHIRMDRLLQFLLGDKLA